MADFYTSNRAVNTLKAMEAIAEHLAARAGTKEPCVGFRRISTEDRVRLAHLDTMQGLAERTGGKAFYNQNAIDAAIRNVLEDAVVTYTIGYYSTNFRDVKVKVDREGVAVRHRKGYFAFGDMATADTKAIESEVRNAIWSPLDATAVALNARVDRITCTLTRNGTRRTGRLDVALVQKNEEGRQVCGLKDTIAMNLREGTFHSMLQKRILMHRDLELNANAKTLRIVVRDAPSGLAGSVINPLARVADAEPVQ